MIALTKVMSRDIKKIGSQASIAAAAKRMNATYVGSLLVEENGVLVGIVTERDLVRKVLAEEKDITSTTIGNIMTTPIPSIDSKRTLLDVQDMMKNRGVRYIAVLEKEKVVGILSVADLLSYFTLSTYSIRPSRIEGSNRADD